MRTARRLGHQLLINPLRLTVFTLLCLVSLITPVKIGRLREARIGEFAPRADFLLRQLRSSNSDSPAGLWFAVVGEPSNHQLLSMFKRHLPIIQNRYLNYLIKG